MRPDVAEPVRERNEPVIFHLWMHIPQYASKSNLRL